MATRRWILSLLPAAAILFLAGCGGSTSNVQNPPPPPQNPVEIAFSQANPPTSPISVGFVENIAATVTNDPNNYGVDWSLVCTGSSGGGNCGTLSSKHSSCQGTTCQPVTYTAPSTLAANTVSCVTTSGSLLPPTDCLPIQIIAYATADHNQNQVASIQIDSFNGQLVAGSYVLQAQGAQSGLPYQFAATISLDGAGNVTSGEQTVNLNGVSVTDQITSQGSSYFIGSDGRGTITLVDPTIGTEFFSFVFLSDQTGQNPQALISQTGVDASSASATGTMDLQNTTAAATQPSGNFAFVVSGIDVLDSNVPLAFGGVLDIPSGQTAITGVTDEIIAGALKLTDGAFSAGSQISAPDNYGNVTITLTGLSSASHTKPVTTVFAGYIVDATHIKLIETDTAANSGVAPFGTTGGLAIAQGAGSQSFSGNYVYGVSGVDLSPINSSYTPSTWTSASLLTSDGAGDISGGFMDNFLQLNCVQATCKPTGSPQGAQIRSSFTGSYSVDSNSRATLNNFTFISAPPNPTYSPTLFFYLTGNAGPDPAALVLAAGDLNSNPKLHYPSIGTGVAYVQSTSNVNLGNCPSGPTCFYGFGFTQVSSGESDGTAQLTANSTASPEVSGIGDSTTAPPPPSDSNASDHAFSGTFASPQSNGVTAGTLSNTNSFGAGSDGIVFTIGNNNATDPYNLFNVDYFPVDTAHGFFVETDLITPSAGSTAGSGQVSFGYYAVRTPVCSSGCR